FFAADAGGFPVITIKSTLRRTNSAASSGRRSVFPSAKRYSKTILFPSIQPSLLSSCRNASTRTDMPEAVPLSRKPMRKIFPACCAPADMQGAKSMALSARTVIFLFMFFPVLSLDTPYSPLFSLDHLIRPREKVGRNRQADLFRCLEINDEFKFRCLLHRQVSRFGTFQDLVYVNSRAPIEVIEARTVKHEAARIDKPLLWVNSWQPVFGSKLDDPLSFSEERASGHGHNRVNLLLFCDLKGAF